MSTTVYATTPVKELSIDQPESNKTRGQVRITDWGDYHDVFPWLLPLKNRVQKPLETARIIKDGLAGLPDLAETFRRKQFGLEQQGDNVTQRILRLFGVTVFQDTTRPYRYRNPHYRYYDERTVPVDSIAERREHYAMWREIPTINSVWLAHHWGISRDGVSKWIRVNYDRRWLEQMQRNHRRMGRTVATHKRWTGDTIREISDSLPVCYNTCKRWVYKWATSTDWHPPEQPCDEHWFMPSN